MVTVFSPAASCAVKRIARTLSGSGLRSKHASPVPAATAALGKKRDRQRVASAFMAARG
jgi:hypothetical protein